MIEMGRKLKIPKIALVLTKVFLIFVDLQSYENIMVRYWFSYEQGFGRALTLNEANYFKFSTHPTVFRTGAGNIGAIYAYGMNTSGPAPFSQILPQDIAIARAFPQPNLIGCKIFAYVRNY